MKKYIFIFALLAIVAGSATVAPTSAEAVSMVEYCGEWPETPVEAMDEGGRLINYNVTSQGTYITIQRTCYTVDPNCGVQGGIGCVTYHTQNRVYHYPVE